jgi:Mg/Co/Ni transporter MgtE
MGPADILEQHVQLSLFMPLIMGHGGNTGAQACSAVLRALALRQVSWRDVTSVVSKEARAGVVMGALIGFLTLLAAVVWPAVSNQVGVVVAISLPIISLWANGLGALLTLACSRLHADPAVTAVPLMTTIVDCTGIVVYFYVAQIVMGVNGGVPHSGPHATGAAGKKVRS